MLVKGGDGMSTVKELRILRGKSMRTSDFSSAEYRDWILERDNSWLCVCGEFITDGCHCPGCGHEPAWGCPCSQHDEEYDREGEAWEYSDFP